MYLYETEEETCIFCTMHRMEPGQKSRPFVQKRGVPSGSMPQQRSKILRGPAPEFWMLDSTKNLPKRQQTFWRSRTGPPLPAKPAYLPNARQHCRVIPAVTEPRSAER